MTCLLYQAVLETVARVKPKKNETKEEKYASLSCRIIGLLLFLQQRIVSSTFGKFSIRSFQFHDVFNLDSENRVEDTPTLIDRKVCLSQPLEV
jgi:hypothetical protein